MNNVEELLDSLNESQLKQIILQLATKDRQICHKIDERISEQKVIRAQASSKYADRRLRLINCRSPQKPKSKPAFIGPFDVVPTELIFHILR